MADRPGLRVVSSLVCGLVFVAAPAVSGQLLAPRSPTPSGALRLPVLEAGAEQPAPLGQQLVIKLVDSVRGRASDGGELRSAAGADLSALKALAQGEGLTFAPLIRLPLETLATLEQRAAQFSGRAQPDLAGMLVVQLPGDEPAELLRVGEALRALPEVEFAFVQALGCPPPGDIAPTTPNLEPNQGYRDPDPGVNVGAAWGQGLRGAGLRVSDCEYGWNYSHEDLVDVGIIPEPGQTIAPGVYSNNWDDHGTAVLGETSSPDNGYGTSGLCPDAEVATYPEWTVEQGFRRVTAITNAIANSDAGDLVLLEMQTIAFGSNYGPAELDAAVYNVVKAGVDAGVVVVGAAGNGNQDLDSSTYATYMGWGDSGAILVGAGSANTSHNKLSFSTYGSRVNVQGWGENVFSTGYGSFAKYGNDPNQEYTAGFNGTSSASPIVTGCATLVQQRSLVVNATPLPGVLLRQILIDTGTAQGSGGHIGPLPELSAAVAAVGGFDPDPWDDLGLGLAGVNGVPVQDANGTLLPGSPLQVTLTGGPLIAFGWWVVGLSNLSAPFKGGTLVPSPDALVGPLTVVGGQYIMNSTFPAGVPAGVAFFGQFWMPDGAAVKGYSASNALKGTAQ